MKASLRTTVWQQPLIVPASIKQCGYKPRPKSPVLILNLELFSFLVYSM